MFPAKYLSWLVTSAVLSLTAGVVVEKNERYSTKKFTGPLEVTTTQRPPVRLRYVNNVLNLKQLVNQAPKAYGVYILYCGSKSEYGYSWCPMCHALEVHLKNLAYYMPQETLLIYAEVGTVEQWKDSQNSFRLCPIKLKTVPTLHNWRTNDKLEGHSLFDFGKLIKFLGIESFTNGKKRSNST